MRVRCFLAMIIGVMFTWDAARALQYERVPLDSAQAVVIQAWGPIVPGDAARLTEFFKTMPASDRIIGFVVDSPGGALVEAGHIAGLISELSLSVVVPSDSKCASACFLLFAAAPRKLAGADALIGVHGASEDGKDDLNSMAATTAFARELTQYGVPPAIIGKMAGTVPGRMEWLTPADLQSMGVVIMADAPPEPPSTTEAPVAPPGSPPTTPSIPLQPAVITPPAGSATPEDWGAYGEWIQLASRDNAADAKQFASDIHRHASNVAVFTSDSGWFVVALGPYQRGKADPDRQKLVSSGVIPSDSMIRSGNHFRFLVWGDQPIKAAPEVDAKSAVAMQAARDFFRASSAPGSQLISYLDSIYTPTVTYFGKEMPKADVLADKQTFVERWPERLYTLDPNGLSASCSADGKCTATATVDLRAHSPERKRTSVLTARFSLTFDTSAAPALVAESSEVLRRSIVEGN